MSGADSRSRRILVTGAGGFVGSRVVELLAARGEDVRAADVVESEVTHRLRELSGVDYQVADLRDSERVRSLLEGVSHIIHLAAVRTKASGADGRLSHEVNVDATFSLIAQARAEGVQRFVFGSSHTVYGAFADSDVPAFREEDLGHTQQGLNFYAATKLAVEAYLEAFANDGGPSYFALRLGTIFGPRVSEGSNGALMVDVLAALDRGERPVVPWTQPSVHALIYVDDVALACLAALDADDANRAVNVVGRPVQAGEVYPRLVELYGGSPDCIVWTDQKSRYQRVDRSRADALFGGLTTTLDDGLTALIQWHRESNAV